MRRKIWPFLPLAALLGLLPTVPGYAQYLLALAGIMAVAALGLNLLLGYGGMVSIGHGAFMALGAYVFALLRIEGVPWWLALPLAGLAASLPGFLLGFPALRLAGPYLAIATLGFQVAVNQLALRLQGITGGYQGLRVPEAWSGAEGLYAVLGTLALLLLWKRRLVQSLVGKALVAVRDNEAAAVSVGIPPAWAKTGVFALSAFYAAVAGGLQAQLVGLVTPFDFGLATSILLLAMVVIGGAGTLWGPLLGAAILFWGFQALSGIPDLRNLVFGALLVVFPLFWPRGVAGFLGRLG
ncbi:branched-chain amino acid ABC transporter permease [Thermus sp. FJN-A]